MITTDRAADRHRRRGGLLLARGVHPRVHQGVRRGAGAVAPQARPHPDRRRPAASTSTHPASLRLPARDKVTSDGPADEDGRAPRLADRRDGRGWPSGSPPSSSTSRSSSTSTRTGRRSGRCCRGWSGRWACGTPRWRRRDYDWSVEEHESLSSMRERLAAEGPTYLAHVRDVVADGPPRRHLRRRAVRAGRGVHLRRHDRPRADLRRAPPDPGRAGARRRTGIEDLGWGDPMRWVAEPTA